MNGFSKDEAARLLELLTEELELFTQFRDLTANQMELIAADEIDALNASLDQKEQIIEKIKGLHQESEVLMQSYVLYSANEEGISNEIDALAERRREMMELCAKLSEGVLSEAQGKSMGYTGKIDEISRNRKGVGAYIQDVENKPEMFDKMR